MAVFALNCREAKWVIAFISFIISLLRLADPHCSKGRHLVRSGEPLHPE